MFLKSFNERVSEDDLSDILDALQYLTDSSPKYMSNDMIKYQDGFLALYYEDCDAFNESHIHVVNDIISKIGYKICSYDFRNNTLYLLIMTLSFLDRLYKKGIELIDDVQFSGYSVLDRLTNKPFFSATQKKVSGQIDLKNDDHILIVIDLPAALYPKIEYYIYICVEDGGDGVDEFEFTNKVEANMELINIQLKHLGINSAIKRMTGFADFNESIKFNDTVVDKEPKGDSFVRKGDTVSLLFDGDKRIGTLHYRIKGNVLHGIWIDVSKDFRGMKYGTKIMEEIFKRAKDSNCSKITLEVMKNNIVAINLYKKFGFEIDKSDEHFLDMSVNI